MVDSANISVPTGLLSEGAYDELGNRYVVPDFCFVDPVNLAVAVAGGGGGGGQEEEVEGEKRRGSDVRGFITWIECSIGHRRHLVKRRKIY